MYFKEYTWYGITKSWRFNVPKKNGQDLNNGMQEALSKSSKDDEDKKAKKQSWLLSLLSGSKDAKPPSNTPAGNVKKKKDMLKEAMED